MSLKYLAAYALVNLNGTAKPTKDQVSKVVSATGAKVDAAELDYVFNALKDKDVNTLIAEGSKKISAGGAPSAGGASAAAAPAAAAPAAGKKEEPKKEEKKKAPEPEDDDDMIGGLF